MISCPPRMTATRPSGSPTRSIAPVTAITQLYFPASVRTSSTARSSDSSVTASSGEASTPCVDEASPSRAFASDLLQRTTETPRFRISSASAVRDGAQPAPTGSSTTGMPRRRAVSCAPRADSRSIGKNVPRLIVSAEAFSVNSTAPTGSSAMTGEAPAASRRLAQPLAVTMFEKHMTRGCDSRTAEKQRTSMASPHSFMPLSLLERRTEQKSGPHIVQYLPAAASSAQWLSFSAA